MLQTTHIDNSILVRNKDDLFKHPVIIYVLDFEDENLALFKHQLEEAHDSGQSILPIVISSYGGSAYGLLEMFDLLSQCKLPIATIVEGKAMSAGAALLTCGKEGYRYCGPHSTIMVHQLSCATTGKNADMQEDVKEYDRVNQKILKIMSKNVGKEEDYFLSLIKAKGNIDLYMSAEQAKKHNIVNHTKLPTLKTFVKVETVLE